MMKTMKEYLDKIKNSASDKDWEYCRENVYIYKKNNESIERFKKRYIAYYTKQLDYFDTKVKKLIDKYKMKSAQKKIVNKKLVNNHIVKHFVDDMIVM